MPGRTVPLVTNEVYHVFNRGINRQPTFINKRECSRALQTLEFYRFAKPMLRLSKFLLLERGRQNEVVQSMKAGIKAVEILAFCLMPNHFHFLLKQRTDSGIAKFIGNFQNSYTRYFNTLHKRDGSLFLDQFKAVRVETDEQLIHLSRYIHLNPYTGFVVKKLNALEFYPYSSFNCYINDEESFISSDFILGFFKNLESYKEFIFDQANYQRELKLIEHLLSE